MSGDNLVQVQSEGLKRRSDAKNFDRKVDINILLNKVRAEEKKERYESIVFFGLIATVILVTGVIVSL